MYVCLQKACRVRVSVRVFMVNVYIVCVHYDIINIRRRIKKVRQRKKRENGKQGKFNRDRKEQKQKKYDINKRIIVKIHIYIYTMEKSIFFLKDQKKKSMKTLTYYLFLLFCFVLFFVFVFFFFAFLFTPLIQSVRKISSEIRSI